MGTKLIGYLSFVLVFALTSCIGTNAGNNKFYIADLETGKTIAWTASYGSSNGESVIGRDDANKCFYTVETQTLENRYIVKKRDYQGRILWEKSPGLPEIAWRVAMSPDCRLLAALRASQNECIVFDFESEKSQTIKTPYRCSDQWSTCVRWLNNSKFVFPVDVDRGKVGLMTVDATSGESDLILEHPVLAESDNYYTSASPNGRYLAFSHRKLLVVDLEKHEALPVINNVCPVGSVLSWSPDSSRLAYMRDKDFRIQIISIPDCTVAHLLDDGYFSVKLLDRNRVLCAYEGNLRVLNLETGEKEVTMPLKGGGGPYFVPLDSGRKVVYTN